MKVLIIGIVASGKTTLAKRLFLKYNIPHFEIDLIVHDDVNNIKRTPNEQREIVDDINKNNDSWIIEGTLRKHMNYLLELADKIILIDIPLKVRKRRIILRYIKQKLGIEKASYKPTLQMLKMMFKWTKEYEEDKALLNTRLKKYNDKLIVLDSVEKIERFTL